MKLNGIAGKGSGKLGANVWAVRNGVQVVREYTDKVLNPKSSAQTKQRAKFKLMSQLAAVMRPFIAIPREGLVSPANRFTALNIKRATYNQGVASIEFDAVVLTDSVIGLPSVVISGRQGTTLPVALNTVTPTGMDRVVYVMMAIQADLTLRVIESVVVDEPGENYAFPHTFALPSASTHVAIYAYGVRDLDEKARVAFGEMEGITADDVARLVTERILTVNDVQLSETRAVVSKP